MPNRLLRKIFNRPVASGHSLHACIESAYEAASGTDIAVLNNLALDHRVPVEREASFRDFCTNLMAGNTRSLFQLLKSYEEREVRLKGTLGHQQPAYLRPENGLNLLHGDLDFRKEVLDSATRLVTVKTGRDVNDGLRRRLAMRFGSDRVDPVDPRALLDVFFDGLSFAEQRSLLSESLVEALNPRRGSDPFSTPDPSCVWATFESDLAPFLAAGPNRWFEFLGLKKYRGEGIAFVVAYKVFDTGALARPTQIDAGLYPPHMPPPPASGHASSTLPWGQLCGQRGAREMLLHQEIVESDRLSVIRWARYVFSADGPSVEELYRARTRRLRYWSRLSPSHREIMKQWLRS